MKEKIKALLTDSMWSIAGLMLMNMVAQFVVYPIWNRQIGSERYGDILYLLSLMNIIAISMGSGCNYARMTSSAKGKTSSTPYVVILAVSSILLIPVVEIIAAYGGVEMSVMDRVLFGLLMCFTMWRFYADVEYRLSLNYKGYFLYYFIISVGYFIGVLIFLETGLWAMALLVGELFGLITVLVKGKTIRLDEKFDLEKFKPVFKMVMVLFGTDVLSAVIFNGDRMLLRVMVGGTAVTSYYLASLLGKTMSLVTTPLNSVIIGHLAKYKGKLTVKFMNIVLGLCMVAILASILLCTVASYIIIPVLYPQEYETVKQFFVVANLAQIFYFAANVVTVVLLRFSSSSYQVIVNVLYAVAFCVLCFPATWRYGVQGFCYALLFTCLVRFLVAIGLGYYDGIKGKREIVGNGN